MAEIINLRQQRKSKTRAEKEKKAASNRALHGQTKAQKQKKKIEEDRVTRLIDGHKREKDDE